jgi:hypothetical protein
MEPLSLAASISSLCSTAVTLISTISEFINDAQQAPVELQTLNNELASLYSRLGRIKLSVQSPRIDHIPAEWSEDFDDFLLDCRATLNHVQNIFVRRTVTEITGTAQQVCKTIRLEVRKKQVELIVVKIVSLNASLQILREALEEMRGAHVKRRQDSSRPEAQGSVLFRGNTTDSSAMLEDEVENEDDAPEEAFTPGGRPSRHQDGPTRPPPRNAPKH